MREVGCDVLVVGAGPSGCAAGIELARAGLSVHVVDRARFPRPKTCGDALSNRAVRIVSELGAGDALDRTPHAVVHGSAVVFPDGSRVLRSYESEPGRIVPRLALDMLLCQALEASGAAITEGVQIRRLTRSSSRVDGAEADGLRYRARAVIAADGPGSVAWSSLGWGYPRGHGLAVSATGYYAGVTPEGAPGYGEHYFERELPGGYGWIFPPVDGVSNVGVYQRADLYKKAGVPLATLLDGFLARHRRRFEQARLVGRVHAWSLPLATPSRHPGAPGLLLSGDAGRFVDPLTGEGIWQALYTGRLAGRVVADALRAGEVDLAAVRRYRRECARTIDWPSAARGAIQQAMRVVVGTGLYRSRLLRAVLERGYTSGSLEITKSVTTR